MYTKLIIINVIPYLSYSYYLKYIDQQFIVDSYIKLVFSFQAIYMEIRYFDLTVECS